MIRPWAIRPARRSPKVGATATATVAGTWRAHAARRQRRRPIRSDRGPQIHDPTTSARTSTEIVSPARLGEIPNESPMVGRTACVEYIVANMADAPTRKPSIPPRIGPSDDVVRVLTISSRIVGR